MVSSKFGDTLVGKGGGVMLDRRSFGAALTLAGLTAASGHAHACSIIGQRIPPIAFDSGACRAQVIELLHLFNNASKLDSAEFEERANRFDLSIDSTFAPANVPDTDLAAIARGFLSVEGRSDTKPVKLAEMKLIRHRGLNASFGLTLRRYRYFPADEEGCNGLFTHGEYWAQADSGFLATFYENRLITLRDFEEWYV